MCIVLFISCTYMMREEIHLGSMMIAFLFVPFYYYTFHVFNSVGVLRSLGPDFSPPAARHFREPVGCRERAEGSNYDEKFPWLLC